MENQLLQAALNENTPTERLRELAVLNPNTPKYLQEKLPNNECEKVRTIAAKSF